MLRCNRLSNDYKSYKISLIADFCRLLEKTVINATIYKYPNTITLNPMFQVNRDKLLTCILCYSILK